LKGLSQVWFVSFKTNSKQSILINIYCEQKSLLKIIEKRQTGLNAMKGISNRIGTLKERKVIFI
jgi:hypothetical protein